MMYGIDKNCKNVSFSVDPNCDHTYKPSKFMQTKFDLLIQTYDSYIMNCAKQISKKVQIFIFQLRKKQEQWLQGLHRCKKENLALFLNQSKQLDLSKENCVYQKSIQLILQKKWKQLECSHVHLFNQIHEGLSKTNFYTNSPKKSIQQQQNQQIPHSQQNQQQDIEGSDTQSRINCTVTIQYSRQDDRSLTSQNSCNFQTFVEYTDILLDVKFKQISSWITDHPICRFSPSHIQKYSQLQGEQPNHTAIFQNGIQDISSIAPVPLISSNNNKSTEKIPNNPNKNTQNSQKKKIYVQKVPQKQGNLKNQQQSNFKKTKKMYYDHEEEFQDLTCIYASSSRQQDNQQQINDSIVEAQGFDLTKILQNTLNELPISDLVNNAEYFKYKKIKFNTTVQVIQLLQMLFCRRNNRLQSRLKFLARDEKGVAVFSVPFSNNIKPGKLFKMFNCMISNLNNVYDIHSQQFQSDTTKVKYEQNPSKFMPGIWVKKLTSQTINLGLKCTNPVYMQISECIYHFYKNNSRSQTQTVNCNRKVVASIIAISQRLLRPTNAEQKTSTTNKKQTDEKQTQFFVRVKIGDFKLRINFQISESICKRLNKKLTQGDTIIIEKPTIKLAKSELLKKQSEKKQGEIKNELVLTVVQGNQVQIIKSPKFLKDQLSQKEWTKA